LAVTENLVALELNLDNANPVTFIDHKGNRQRRR
jgi:hypothetical protein